MVEVPSVADRQQEDADISYQNKQNFADRPAKLQCPFGLINSPFRREGDQEVIGGNGYGRDP